VVKTIVEFKDEIRMIRADMNRRGEFADTKLIASWLDRLLISLEAIAPQLDLMAIELEELVDAVDALASQKKAKSAGKKKPAKKKGKKKR